MPGALYLLQIGSGDVARWSQRALLRVQESDAVVAPANLDPRLLSILPHSPRHDDPVVLAQTGLKVAWLVWERPPLEDCPVPWEYVPAAAAAEHGQGACPLYDLGVVVTRPRHQGEDLVTRLSLLGARAYSVPSILLRPPASYDILDGALAELESFHWLVFTSANAVAPFLLRLRHQGRDARHLAHVRIAAIGPATARALEAVGLVPDRVPEEFVAESLLEALVDVEGKRFLIPRAAEARDVLPEGLRQRGAEVVVAPVYETVPNPEAEVVLQALFDAGKVDVVTFTASSTVTHFPLSPRGDMRVVCIGPVTARTAEKRGWKVHAQPAEYTTDGLVAEILKL